MFFKNISIFKFSKTVYQTVKFLEKKAFQFIFHFDAKFFKSNKLLAWILRTQTSLA